MSSHKKYILLTPSGMPMERTRGFSPYPCATYSVYLCVYLSLSVPLIFGHLSRPPLTSKARSCVRGEAPGTIYAILEREIRADVWARGGVAEDSFLAALQKSFFSNRRRPICCVFGFRHHSSSNQPRNPLSV